MSETRVFKIGLPSQSADVIDTLAYVRRYTPNSIVSQMMEEAIDRLPEPLQLAPVQYGINRTPILFRLDVERATILGKQAAQHELPPSTLACEVVHFRVSEVVDAVPELDIMMGLRDIVEQRLK